MAESNSYSSSHQWCCGKMGREVVKAVAQAEDMTLVVQLTAVLNTRVKTPVNWRVWVTGSSNTDSWVLALHAAQERQPGVMVDLPSVRSMTIFELRSLTVSGR